MLGKPHRPLMLCPPENLLELLSMPSLAGRSPVEALTNFPFLGMYTPEKIKRLEKIMNSVPDFRLSHIKLLKPIYNLHPDTMEERMEYALSNWPTVRYPGRTGEGPDPDHILLARGSPESGTPALSQGSAPGAADAYP
ncbi:unnamed protein product [Cyprideis torosa]|uniref:Uncharacterized protein n=1 Tax=Cyprideis torosa TaxID=163714 RepID=A0A7R8ZUB0_9CRUS|nr:unnamed protein product [Cyprideis torosa]CAG0905571.1 unnamed protein product [Cyprideis torosa]